MRVEINFYYVKIQKFFFDIVFVKQMECVVMGESIYQFDRGWIKTNRGKNLKF